MFPSFESMELSSQLAAYFGELVPEFLRMDLDCIVATKTEVQFFDAFFPKIQTYLDNKELGPLTIRCRTKRTHQKPIVSFLSGDGQPVRRELGDYFINVKYLKPGQNLGSKFVVYQLKRADSNSVCDLDPHQIWLLSHWPSFEFGKKQLGYWSFSLAPITPDLGSFWLIPRSKNHRVFDKVCSSLFLSSNNIRSVTPNNDIIPPFCGPLALFEQMTWRYGEYVEASTPIKGFMDTLYRYVGLDPDPPEEFEGFSSDQGPFWGMEITVKYTKKAR